MEIFMENDGGTLVSARLSDSLPCFDSNPSIVARMSASRTSTALRRTAASEAGLETPW